MARVAREKSETDIYHIMLRGSNRTIIFQDQEDREYFIERLKKLVETKKWNLYAYCLMDNHVHILIREQEDEIATSIKRICSSYVYHYNKKYDRIGHLFQERFKSEVVETDSYFLTVIRYIHQNPSQAGMPMYLRDKTWTSYNDYVDKPIKVDVKVALGIFSKNLKQAKEMFVAYHNANNKDKCLSFNDFVRYTDAQAIAEIKNIGIDNITTIDQAEKEERDYILNKVKTINGISIRQIARITGISRSVIDRA